MPSRQTRPADPPLTSLSSCAGCAAKLSQPLLARTLRGLAQKEDPNLLIGAATSDDAGVYRLRSDLALVQTVDFFTPIVDSPYDFGQIAAANALSDVYAMGGRPITAMALVGAPTDRLSMATIQAIVRGGADKVKEAGACLVGGHTIRLSEPIYGLAVSGLVNPRRVTSNAAARPGDLLLLTKPLGMGIATTALKRGLASPGLVRRAVEVMSRLNVAGAELAEAGLVQSATDVTGFGLLGHLASMCRASGVGAEIYAGEVPALAPEIFRLIQRDCVPGGTRSNLEAVEPILRWDAGAEPLRILLADAQTSGGLLLCVRPDRLDRVLETLNRCRTPCAVLVGRIVKAARPRITVV